LKRTRLLQKNAPLVITAGQVETASVRHALRQGAFDYISSPLDLIQMVHTVRLALWYSQIQHLIAFHRYALERYYVHMVTDPDDKDLANILGQGLVAVNKSFEAAKETVTRMRRSVEDFDHIAVDVEKQASSKRSNASTRYSTHVPQCLSDLTTPSGRTPSLGHERSQIKAKRT
jgi:Response regulator containing CheY-like receiver, AAA-type ATPase, and DNA-binding domains